MKIDKEVLDRIPTTRDKAIHLQAIISELAISESQAKAIVKLLRLQGVPICSDYKGYWIAESDQDYKWYLEQMEQQGFSRAAIRRGTPQPVTNNPKNNSGLAAANPKNNSGQGYHQRNKSSKGA